MPFFVDGVVRSAARQGGKAVRGAVLVDDDRRGGGPSAAREHIVHIAGGIQIQRQGGAGVQQVYASLQLLTAPFWNTWVSLFMA